MKINDLPNEILLKIFLRLEYGDIISAGSVCRQWQVLSEDDVLLHKIAHRDFCSLTWSCQEFFPSGEAIHHATMLVGSGHLPPDFLSCKVAQVTRAWAQPDHTPHLQEVAMAASLAYFGHLKHVQCMKLKNLDISRNASTFTTSVFVVLKLSWYIYLYLVFIRTQ